MWIIHYYTYPVGNVKLHVGNPCSLTALMPLESIANLSDAIAYSYLITLHYITFSLTIGLRTVYLINLKNLIWVDIVKCLVQFCLVPDFLNIFLTNLASTGGPHEISRRATCGPRAGLL